MSKCKHCETEREEANSEYMREITEKRKVEADNERLREENYIISMKVERLGVLASFFHNAKTTHPRYDAMVEELAEIRYPEYIAMGIKV